MKAFRATLVAIGFAATGALAQETTRVSVTTDGYQSESASLNAAISGDGRFVVFEGWSYALVAGDTNRLPDIFLRDRATGETVRISLGPNRVQADGRSFQPAISANGRFVAFLSEARNLVPNDDNFATDVFVRDLETGVNTLVSVSSDGQQTTVGNDIGTSGLYRSVPSLSADGRFVVFSSPAATLVPDDINFAVDVFLHDMQTGTTERVSLNSAGLPATEGCFRPSISADGRYVLFESDSRNLRANEGGHDTDVFLRDRVDGTTTMMTVTSTDDPAASGGDIGSMSADARFIAFESVSANLDPTDLNVFSDVYVHDRETGATTRVSYTPGHGNADGSSMSAAMSPDGRSVAFVSRATNLVPGDNSNQPRLFLHDMQTGLNVRVDVDSQGAPGVYIDGSSQATWCSFSQDGRFVTFSSNSALVSDDTNTVADVFVREHPFASAGTVGASHGFVTPVLRANGATGVVETHPGIGTTITLDAPPTGPSFAKYVLWVWAGPPSDAHDVFLRGAFVGTTVGPTPLVPGATPQPIVCIHGTGIPTAACAGTTSRLAAPRAPFTIRRAHGFAAPTTLTFQGIVEDVSAGNALGLSTTNAMILRVD
jgi:Tol biopolymer transport system component